MAYLLSKDGKPYYTTGCKAFPCAVSANRVEVDFKNPVDKVDANGCIYTESEIRKRLNIKMIDSWDAENEKVVKVSNKTVSSIIVEETEPKEEKVTEEEPKEEKKK
ncbi:MULTISPECIES: hypothetical protein [Erysipelotrichaceae]|jgi:hypothetical protein|uniref:hypothetical protein n=1 Tax=Erysipelotrichaceae TaxID=128827 RepID=UPI000E4FE4FB|nr:hypothetical protein [Absiella sp. AM27-20]RHT97934.1 hypothetical protein DW716_23420 [Absiella sp. AM27-20]